MGPFKVRRDTPLNPSHATLLGLRSVSQAGDLAAVVARMPVWHSPAGATARCLPTLLERQFFMRRLTPCASPTRVCARNCYFAS